MLVNTAGGCFSSHFDVGIFCAILLSALYTMNVFTHIVHYMASGAIASWWFNASSTPNTNVVGYSFSRAITYSFGSICLGSLVVAPVGITRFFLRYLKSMISCSTRNGCCAARYTTRLLSCLDSVLKSFENTIKHCNRYAYCYAAIYGTGFSSASV